MCVCIYVYTHIYGLSLTRLCLFGIGARPGQEVRAWGEAHGLRDSDVISRAHSDLPGELRGLTRSSSSSSSSSSGRSNSSGGKSRSSSSSSSSDCSSGRNCSSSSSRRRTSRRRRMSSSSSMVNPNTNLTRAHPWFVAPRRCSRASAMRSARRRYVSGSSSSRSSSRSRSSSSSWVNPNTNSTRAHPWFVARRRCWRVSARRSACRRYASGSSRSRSSRSSRSSSRSCVNPNTNSTRAHPWFVARRRCWRVSPRRSARRRYASGSSSSRSSRSSRSSWVNPNTNSTRAHP